MYENAKYPNSVQYMNMETGLARVRGNVKLYKRMLGLFVASDEFAKLEEAIANKDATAAADIAHAIKGMTGNLSLDDIFHISEDLMHKFRANEFDEDSISRYRESLKITFEILEDAIAYLDSQG